MTRRTVLVASALGLATLVALGLMWSVTAPRTASVSSPMSGPVSSPQSAPLSSSADPGTASSGKGIVLKFSDKPVPVPALALSDLDGRPVSTDSLRGKVALINFWATWCGPCREEIPMLVALQARYRDRLVIVGLSIDTRPPAEVQAFAKQFAIDYPVAIAPEALQQSFGGVEAVPSTFVVTKDGKIVQRHVGSLNPAVTEQEVRVLSGLPSEAAVQTVHDTGQVLLANAAYATEIPGIDLSVLTPAQKGRALERMNTERCKCGCGLTIAQCRINDPTCDVSLPLAQQIVKEVQQTP